MKQFDTEHEERSYLLDRRSFLIKTARSYYGDDNPIISDAEYDQLFKEVKALEEKHPDLISPKSPTQTVGGKLKAYLDPVKHLYPMLSLDNVFDKTEVSQWLNGRDVKRETVYYMDCKLDGIAVSLHYHYGRLVQGLTRGDGATGEDITHNVKQCNDVPEIVFEWQDIEHVEVRGEAVMPKGAFNRINRERSKIGKKLLVNCRNAAAGAMRGLDPKTVRDRAIRFIAYGMPGPLGDGEHISVVMEALDKSGFCLAPHRLCKTEVEIEDFYQEIVDQRDHLPYDIDGMVIKANHPDVRKKMGTLSRYPRWAVAYKFPSDKQWTQLDTVEFQTGRTGAVTPVAKIKPVFVGGVTVSSVTLHNKDEIKRLNLTEECEVLVERAGDVIPKIIETRGGNGRLVQFVEQCKCGEPVEPIPGRSDVLLYCTNPFCSEQAVEKIIQFVSRDCFDIDGMGEVIVENLYENGDIKTIADVLDLSFEALCKAANSQVIAQKILNQIDEKRKIPLARYLYALGIFQVGERTAKDLARRFKTRDCLIKATVSELTSIEGIGSITAGYIISFFHPDSISREIEQRLYRQCEVLPDTFEVKENPELVGKSFCITGSFDSVDRKELKKLIEYGGGKCSGSVSSKTDILIAGRNAGSKLAAAHEREIPVWDEIQVKSVLGL